MRALHTLPPQILVIDDLFGRDVAGGNEDRKALCLQLRLEDITDEHATDVRIRDPLARAVFCRGQLPGRAGIGDLVKNDVAGTLRIIDSGWHNRGRGVPPWALILLDLRFRTGTVTVESERLGAGVPEGRPDDSDLSTLFGLQLLEEIQERFPQLPVVVLSDAPRESVSRQSTTLGATAFLAKDDVSAADKLAEYLQRHALVPDPSGEIVGTSIPLLLALRNARRAAIGGESVLIRGETGTGKELIACYIHRQDRRRSSGPLVLVDSGRLSPERYETELFGHVRGAFTGAVADRPGFIVEAHRGTLFLDEIGNIDGTVQRGLLRALQEKQVRPVGGSRSREVDVRFVFATNGDIEAHAAAENGFRLDLLERMRQGGTIVLPPLRERLEDLPALVEALVRKAEAKTPGAVRRRVDPDVMALIAQQPWPGNIRQLYGCLLGAVGARPDVEHLVPIHLQIPNAVEGSPRSRAKSPQVEPLGLSAAITLLQRLDPTAFPAGELVGRYGELEAAFARAAMHYLRACLNAVRRPTVRKPDGEVLVNPAVKLMLGQSNVNASQAYDFVIRLHNLSSVVATEWDDDTILGPLFEHARSQRRASRRPEARAANEMENRHG